MNIELNYDLNYDLNWIELNYDLKPDALRIFLIWIMIALNMACLEARWHREDDPNLNETEVMKMEAQVLWVSFYPSIGRASQHRWEMDVMEDREGLDLFSWRGSEEVYNLAVLSLLLLLLLLLLSLLLLLFSKVGGRMGEWIVGGMMIKFL